MNDIPKKVPRNDIDIQCRLKYEAPYYWVIEGDLKEGPYCQCCQDTDKKLVRLIGNGEGFWECKACKNTYKDSNYKPDLPIIVSLPSQLQQGLADYRAMYE
jgi:ribosomal protein L37AE/L43A